MRLLTHNFLCCLKCEHSPLEIIPKKVESITCTTNDAFLLRILPRLNYESLKRAAGNLKITGLPDSLPNNVEENDNAMKALHKLLMEVEIVSGTIKCEKCQREYPIVDKIANFVLNDEEIEEINKLKKDIQRKERKEKNKLNQKMKEQSMAMLDEMEIPTKKEKKRNKKDDMQID